MDLATLIRTIVRRWYVTLPALALVIVAAAVVIGSAEPEYSAERSVVLLRTGVLPPEAAADAADDAVGSDVPVPQNPYTEFNASVAVAAEVMQEVAVSGEVRRTVSQEGLSNDYTVAVDENAPILVIESVAESPDAAIASADRVAQIVDEDLERRQARFGVPDDSRIVTEDVVVPDRATRLDSDRNRALIGVAVLGVVFIVLVALLAEYVARAIHRRRDRRGQEVADPPHLDDAAGSDDRIDATGDEAPTTGRTSEDPPDEIAGSDGAADEGTGVVGRAVDQPAPR